MQLHVSDFVPNAAPPSTEERLGLGSFLPRPDGGLRFKVFLRERDPRRVYAITKEIVKALQGEKLTGFVTLRELAR